MPAGRRSKYVAEFHIPWARSLARRGLTVEEIAKEMNVARSTFNKWVAENSALSDALNEGRDAADSKVEASLYKRALGYTVTEKKTIAGTDKDGAQKAVRVEIVEKEVQPDTTACIFWLKNRQPQLWREQQTVNLNTPDEQAKKEVAELIDKIVRKRNEEK